MTLLDGTPPPPATRWVTVRLESKPFVLVGRLL
jgi:hypothetical protein